VRENTVARPTSGLDMCCAARPLKPATLPFEGDILARTSSPATCPPAHEQGSAGDGSGDDVPGTGEVASKAGNNAHPRLLIEGREIRIGFTGLLDLAQHMLEQIALGVRVGLSIS
jgi:hypothetical protein